MFVESDQNWPSRRIRRPYREDAKQRWKKSAPSSHPVDEFRENAKMGEGPGFLLLQRSVSPDDAYKQELNIEAAAIAQSKSDFRANCSSSSDENIGTGFCGAPPNAGSSSSEDSSSDVNNVDCSPSRSDSSESHECVLQIDESNFVPFQDLEDGDDLLLELPAGSKADAPDASNMAVNVEGNECDSVGSYVAALLGRSSAVNVQMLKAAIQDCYGMVAGLHFCLFCCQSVAGFLFCRPLHFELASAVFN